MNKQLPFRIFVSAIFIALHVPMLIQDGMFLDGVVYAAVSNNLALGMGSFWDLTFSETFMKDYTEQLPLFFGIQALFFKILGSSIYSERIFGFITACISAYFIIKIWRITQKDDQRNQELEWLPILLWITIPVCFWTYANNVQETLMSVFATAAVYYILKGLIEGKKIILYLFLGGLFIFCCSFCKGFQGLFPLVTVAFYWLFTRRITLKKAISYSLALLFVPLMIYLVLLSIDVSYHNIVNNFNNRIVRTFTSAYSRTTDNHFHLLFRIFTELIPALSTFIVMYIIHRLKFKNVEIKHKLSYIGFFLSIGIAGSFPLMVTTEQRGFYLVTSLPFYALSIAVLIAPFLSQWMERMNVKSKTFVYFRALTIILLIGVVIISVLQFGKTKRDKAELHDIYVIGNSIPHPSVISIPPNLRENYSLGAYFVRHFNISMDTDTLRFNEYYLDQLNSQTKIPVGYSKVGLDLKEYELFRRNDILN